MLTVVFLVRTAPGTGWMDRASGGRVVLTILGQQDQFCDGIPRRSFLRIGGLALGGMSLSQMLEAEARAGIRSSHKAIIMILLPGGPPHLDMYDLKPEAPLEIRGEFKPIRTNVRGIEICELLPRLASIMDKLVIVRSLHGGLNDHNVHQCLTGWETHPQQGDSQMVPGFPQGGWPSMGAAISKLQGGVNPAMPPFISLAPPNAESTTRAALNQAARPGRRRPIADRRSPRGRRFRDLRRSSPRAASRNRRRRPSPDCR